MTSMLDQLRLRVQELHAEFDMGQKKLAQLDAQSAELRQTLLRISGAIQVLEEEIQKAEPAPAPVKN
jgi:prefoldin subunit 5